MNRPRLQAGFMLIEVMISVLIFAVGVLALVSLQAAMTKAQTEAKVRSDAANLANELLGMMWSDSSNLAGYSDGSCASTSQCAGWQKKVTLMLPSAVTQVTTNAATGYVTITLKWTLPGGTQHQYLMATVVKT